MKMNPQQISLVLLRLAIGLNIFIHGAVRLGPNYQKFVDWTVSLFVNSPLPEFLVAPLAYSIPVLEVLIGAFIILGLFTLPSFIAGQLLMIVLMSGMCVLQKWDTVGVQLPYILVYFILIYTSEQQVWKLDKIVFKAGQ